MSVYKTAFDDFAAFATLRVNPDEGVSLQAADAIHALIAQASVSNDWGAPQALDWLSLWLGDATAGSLTGALPDGAVPLPDGGFVTGDAESWPGMHGVLCNGEAFWMHKPDTILGASYTAGDSWGTSLTSGTIDPDNPMNSVISVGGEVLALPV